MTSIQVIKLLIIVYTIVVFLLIEALADDRQFNSRGLFYFKAVTLAFAVVTLFLLK